MSSDIAIKVDSLAKCYHIYDKPRGRLLQMFMRGRRKYYREFWALRGVSLEIRKGETVGIVGRNGSGKSTLLQCICGTLNATSGSIITNGRVAALLELGAGFNPEFSGRENVYMNAAVLGLSREETDARFEKIEAFANIGDFLDQPVKTYSSGMVVRLAFAVAINVDAQILIVDEALAVGDELFQRKCFARIEALKQAGATILFVSHSGGVVIELCDRAILLDGGRKLSEGAPKKIIGQYQKLLYAPEERVKAIRQEILASTEGALDIQASDNDESIGKIEQDVLSPRTDLDSLEMFDPNLISTSTLSYESLGVVINMPAIQKLNGEPVNCLQRGGRYLYTYNANFEKSAEMVRFGMMIKTLSGVEIGGAASSPNLQSAIVYVASGHVQQVIFEFECNLMPGTYFLNAGVTGLVDGCDTYLHRVIDACLFRVVPENNLAVTGIVDFKCVPRLI